MPVIRPPIRPILSGLVNVGKILCPSPAVTIRPFDSKKIGFSCR